MDKKKKNNTSEKVILFVVFLVFAGVVVSVSTGIGNFVNGNNGNISEPFQYETETKSKFYDSSSSADSSQPVGKININTATKQELMLLAGIGEKKADAIIEYRENGGIFKNPEDIKNVSGIGDTIYDNFKNSICVE